MLGSSAGGEVSNLHGEEKRIEAGFEVLKKAGVFSGLRIPRRKGLGVGFSVKRGKSFACRSISVNVGLGRRVFKVLKTWQVEAGVCYKDGVLLLISEASWAARAFFCMLLIKTSQTFLVCS